MNEPSGPRQSRLSKINKTSVLRTVGTLISLVLLIDLLYQQGWEQIMVVIRQIPPWRLILALGLMIISRFAVAARWHTLLRSADAPGNDPISFRQTLRITFAGLFASNFLPTTVGGDLPEFYKALGKTAEFVYGASQWEPGLSYPGARQFAAVYESEFGRPPSYHAAAAYAACMLMAEAINRTGSLDAERLREHLFNLSTTTVFGAFDVDERGYQLGHRMVMIQWQEGRQVIVWPEEVAAGKARFPTPPWGMR
jgi:hypothetical protein